ncbi:hypothetical protein AAE026_29210 [Bradyrhizobium sp. DN5]|uniref:hypothetical protein n=1 Tax=Bradyrhizobium sp. DN5 TaxID=3056950 RepID=UPI003526A901
MLPDNASRRVAERQPSVASSCRRVRVFGVIWSRKELKSLKDLQGQKIRVISPDKAEFIKRMDGSPVTLGTAEVPAARSRRRRRRNHGKLGIWPCLARSLQIQLPAQPRLCQLAVAREQARVGPVVAVLQATVMDTVREISDKTTKAMAAEDQDLTRKLASQMTETMLKRARAAIK